MIWQNSKAIRSETSNLGPIYAEPEASGPQISEISSNITYKKIVHQVSDKLLFLKG